MSDLVKVAEEQKEELAGLIGKLREFAQPRSAYTIEKHIVCAQETPEQQFKQTLDELWVRLNSLQDLLDERELAEIDLRAAEDEFADLVVRSRVSGSDGQQDERTLRAVEFDRRRKGIEVRRIRRKLVGIDYQLEGTTREIRILLEIKKHLPDFTWEDFEKSQAGYWEKRLARQWWLAHIAPGNQGNLDAILNLYTPLGQDRPQVADIRDAAAMLELGSSPKAVRVLSQQDRIMKKNAEDGL